MGGWGETWETLFWYSIITENISYILVQEPLSPLASSGSWATAIDFHHDNPEEVVSWISGRDQMLGSVFTTKQNSALILIFND